MKNVWFHVLAVTIVDEARPVMKLAGFFVMCFCFYFFCSLALTVHDTKGIVMHTNN